MRDRRGGEIQFGAAACLRHRVDALRTYIGELCRSEQIKLITEEASCDSLKRYSVTNTVAAAVAQDMGLKYRMVDLPTDERTFLGIADAQLAGAALELSAQPNAGPLRERLSKISNQVREGVWVARTLQLSTWPALLIIGADHVRAVEGLVQSLRQKIVVAHPDYEP